MNDGSILPAGALIPIEVNMRNARSWVRQGKIVPVPDAAVSNMPAAASEAQPPVEDKPEHWPKAHTSKDSGKKNR
jgi:hypothetical protein